MSEISLENVSTKVLVDELKRRQGVSIVSVGPEEGYELMVGNADEGQLSEYSDDGPAIILIIID